MKKQIRQILTHLFQKQSLTLFLIGMSFLLLPTFSVSAESAAELLKMSGVKGGLIAYVGCGDGGITAGLRASDAYLVHGIDTHAGQIDAARKNLLKSSGKYGPVSVDRWDGRNLPYADNLVNLIIVKEREQLSDEEMLRVLAPRGVALIFKSGKWEKVVKPWPKEMDEWTHYLHGADGNPVGEDSLVGPPTRLQWVGSPRWSRHHDHMASMSSLVSAGGRLFYIFDEGPTASIMLPSRWRLIARDAFNSVILWKREITEWNTHQYPLKSGPADLLRRLVAVGDRVFVTLSLDAPVTVLDAATGETTLTFKGSEFTREIVVSEGVAYFVADLSRSLLPDWHRRDTYVWANSRRANPDWGWKGQERKILAYDAATGAPLWQADSPVAPCSLAVAEGRAAFHDGEKLVCLNAKNGSPLWTAEPTTIKLPIETKTGPRVLIYKEAVLFAGNDGKMSGWSLKDGRKLWENKHRDSGHQSLKDLFVVQGLAWTGAVAGSGDSGAFAGYDPITGKLMREFDADVQVHWFHHRCYPAKATGKFLLMARNGTEFVDLDAEHWKPHHWVRGGCIYGVMPCNGLTYAPMSSCGCQMEAKLNGFNALASGPIPQPSKAELSSESRLERGPAYGKAEGPVASATDWPTYRHDKGRSGASSAKVSPTLKQGWQTKIGGRLSAPIIAAGKIFVAAIDAHTLHALDAKTGRALWSHTTGGRIDSPPTYYKGLVLCGSADGYVYALRAADGALAWRFRGAPLDRRMMAWEQLESAWPVHGSVLIHNGVLYCTAGRNMYLDGGVRFLRLDPETGELLGETVMDDTDPESGEDMHLAYLKKTNGNNMPVAHTDVLSCDGDNIWMRSQKITCDGKRLEIGLKSVTEQPNEDFHLFCQNGFLDDSYFFRSYWTYGRRVTGGYGGWLKAGNLVPSGRILCFDEERVYGFGRKVEYMANSSVLEYQVFAADKQVTKEAIEKVAKVERELNSRTQLKNAASSDWLARRSYADKALSATNFQWILDQPSVLARAMAVSTDTLFIAGPPDIVDERRAFHQPDEAEVQAKLKRQADALEGRSGGQLWAFNKADGKLAARYALDTIPVFDGMAVAGESLFMTTVDGRVIRLAASGAAALQKIDAEPIRIAWDQPENPNYLRPPEVRKEEDFAKVSRCKVIASELGYRVQSAGKQQTSVAIKKLERPITDTVTFKTRMKDVSNLTGLLRNGYLAFGNGTTEGKLIKCGVRFKNQTASIVQGPLKDGRTKGAKILAPEKEIVEIEVRVDLKAQTIVLTANGVRIESEILRPLKSITHVGYVLESAVMDFAPVEIQRP